jgi:hypothetical protein
MNISIDFNHKFKMKIKTVINSIQVLWEQLLSLLFIETLREYDKNLQ